MQIKALHIILLDRGSIYPISELVPTCITILSSRQLYASGTKFQSKFEICHLCLYLNQNYVSTLDGRTISQSIIILERDTVLYCTLVSAWVAASWIPTYLRSASKQMPVVNVVQMLRMRGITFFLAQGIPFYGLSYITPFHFMLRSHCRLYFMVRLTAP